MYILNVYGVYLPCLGFPDPEVTWLHHGIPLAKDPLCSTYNQDGCYYLNIKDAAHFSVDEIVCRVENEVGFAHKTVSAKILGEKVDQLYKKSSSKMF